MPRLILLNGAPGTGKSTLAELLAQDQVLTLALDVDGIKHSLGGWSEDAQASGLRARRLALAMAREQLRSGHDVVVGQYLARTDFIDSLEALAEECGATFVECLLELDAPTLARRLADRAAAPTRPEHQVNTALVGPQDADRLVRSLDGVRQYRPNAVQVSAEGSIAATLDLLRAAVRRADPAVSGR
ncbi:AAA family ATPase [Myceligenerans xiligouense]|uniref:AAA domain-containing protein n=1 Tax=Myceligenerans xiligouense TaxID=253184 RepID=A0A3N4YR40_9MICO|nr:AAA family ATPase [Myceligenerans xiligouense]RPF21834.1 AAA domain-containing protein [Myceligenerans xiligouense]